MIFSDAGARGNPGPAAIAFVIMSEDEEVLTTDSCFIGSHTNNQAEYKALIAALESAIDLQVEEATCHLDSELVTKQVNGEYQVRNLELRKMWNKVQELKKRFEKLSFVSVPRNNIHIQKVDALVNETLDKELG